MEEVEGLCSLQHDTLVETADHALGRPPPVRGVNQLMLFAITDGTDSMGEHYPFCPRQKSMSRSLIRDIPAVSGARNLGSDSILLVCSVFIGVLLRM